MTMQRLLSPFVLGLALAGPAAADDGPGGIRAEMRQDLAEARHEVRVDLAQARRELDTGPLRLDNSLSFGQRRKAADVALPQAEITAQGDLLIAGRAQAIDAVQRRALLAYRGQVIDVAKAGIDIGERSAEIALAAVDVPVASLVFGAFTGGLERRIERSIAREVEPAVRGLCARLPALMASQQRLAASVPQFRPYAQLRHDDVNDCTRLGRDAFATR
jgi:hypothetical protein